MKVLVISPHPDDEVLGCGGTIAKRVAEGDEVAVCIVSEGKPHMYNEELLAQVKKEIKEAHKALGVSVTYELELCSAELDNELQRKVNGLICSIVSEFSPEEVYIPHRGDVHIDHQIVADAAMVALRPRIGTSVKRVLSYEVMSETDWNVPNQQNAFIPNVYEDISLYLDSKCEAMMCYRSQTNPAPSARSIWSIKSLAAHRGAVVEKSAAEAFMLIREVR